MLRDLENGIQNQIRIVDGFRRGWVSAGEVYLLINRGVMPNFTNGI